MVGQLTENEAALLRAVAIWLRDEMVSRLTDGSPSKDLLHDLAQSNFETSCSALERIGMVKSEGEYWSVLGADTDAAVFAGQHRRSDLDHLLDALACHSHYVKDLSRHDEAVTPAQPALRDVCRALAQCGYMEATSAKAFEWTDDFGPWLVRHGAWELDAFEQAPQADVALALSTIPEQGRALVSGAMCRHGPDFVRCFFAQWIDGKWDADAWRTAPSDDWDLCLAAGLYAKLHG